MKEKARHILVADYVPLANKGEEAIIRGIEDIFRDERPIEIGLFGNVNEVTQHGNIVIFPRKWIYRLSGESYPFRKKLFKELMMSLQMRLGYYSILNNLISSSSSIYRPLNDFFQKAEIILAGHNGVFCLETCGVIHLAKKHGKHAGILGSGIGICGHQRLYLSWIFRRTMDESDFFTFRERFSYESMKRICNNEKELILAPDPAFAMKPAEVREAHKVLESYKSYRGAIKAGKNIIAVTVREKGITYRYSFIDVAPERKVRVHADCLGYILDNLIQERNAFLIFLPHAIEKGNSDVDAARHVAQSMNSNSDDYVIIDEDLGARVLKSIIRECDFLVGERAHSAIGAISVATPFVILTNKVDFRTHGIIGDMCGCEGLIFNMERPNLENTRERIFDCFDKREDIKNKLEKRGAKLSEKLKQAAEHIQRQNINERVRYK